MSIDDEVMSKLTHGITHEEAAGLIHRLFVLEHEHMGGNAITSPDVSLRDYGFDSFDTVEFSIALEDAMREGTQVTVDLQLLDFQTFKTCREMQQALHSKYADYGPAMLNLKQVVLKRERENAQAMAELESEMGDL